LCFSKEGGNGGTYNQNEKENEKNQLVHLAHEAVDVLLAVTVVSSLNVVGGLLPVASPG
jgi:hypothetical protein